MLPSKDLRVGVRACAFEVASSAFEATKVFPEMFVKRSLMHALTDSSPAT